MALNGVGTLRQEEKPIESSSVNVAQPLSDKVGSPTPRWQHRVTLAKALYSIGDDDGARAAYREASDVIRAYAESLKPEQTVEVYLEKSRDAHKSKKDAADSKEPRKAIMVVIVSEPVK